MTIALHSTIASHSTIVGIDPGLVMTGVTILYVDGTAKSLVIKGPPASEPMGFRLVKIVYNVCGAIPITTKVAGLENNYVARGRSAQTALKQREVIGALRMHLTRENIEVIPVAPLRAKLALAGKGTATKEEMVEAAIQWGLDIEDELKSKQQAMADALGVALVAKEKNDE